MVEAVTEPVEVAPAAADEAPAFVVPSVVVPHIPASAYAPAAYQANGPFVGAAARDVGTSLLSFVFGVAVFVALFFLVRRAALGRCRCPSGMHHCDHCRR